MNDALECRLLRPELGEALGRFFERLSAAGIDKYFHPHPLTRLEGDRLSRYAGKDLYYALLLGGDVIGYGMLRGWDESYEIPSLGIAIDPLVQGRGYGRFLMEFLHAAARARSVKRIRLKVYAENTRAAALYKSLGYVFQDEQSHELVGFLSLAASAQ